MLPTQLPPWFSGSAVFVPRHPTARAVRAKALGMRVVALRRNPQRSMGDECVDELLPLTELHSAMVRM